MLKNVLFLLLLTFFSTSCAERGVTPKVNPSKQHTIHYSNQVPTPRITVKQTNDEFWDESTKNNFSGSLILVIGLIILL